MENSPYSWAWNPASVELAIRDMLALDTDVFDHDRGAVRADLSEQGQRLARLFALATSRRRGRMTGKFSETAICRELGVRP